MRIDNARCFNDYARYLLSTSSGVKITSQGMYFFEDTVIHISNTHPCFRVLEDGLCANGNYTFMPCTLTPSTSVLDAARPFDVFWRNEACTSGVKIPSLYHFDVLPCDLRRGTSLLWSENQISVMYDTEMTYWPCLVLSLIIIWLVINLGESIALMFKVDGTERQNHITCALCVILIGIIIATTPWGMWSTAQEQWMYVFIIIYILAYSAFHLKNPHTINVVVGCLALVTSRFYQTQQTPYTPGFMFIIATRTVQKLYRVDWRRWEDIVYETSRLGFIAMDVVLFVFLYTLSLLPSYDTHAAQLMLIGLIFAAWTLGRFAADQAPIAAAKQPTSGL